MNVVTQIPNWVWEIYGTSKVKSVYKVIDCDFPDVETYDLMRAQIVGEYLEK